MRAPHPEPDLLALRRLAEELAQSRKEATTGGNLLAATVSPPSQAAELLLERKLGADTLLKAARAPTDEEPDPLARAVQRARELASRMGTTGPSPVHLLLALIHDRKNGAHRALAQRGVDVARLRAAAIHLALGRVGPRRNTPDDRESECRPTVSHRPAQAASRALGVKVPLTPRIATPSPAPAPPPTPAPALVPVARLLIPPTAQASTPKKKARASSSASRFALDPKAFPTLSTMGKNLTLAAAEGALDPVIGRDVEIDQSLDILAKRQGNNPILIGPAGVGKTSVVQGIAQRIAARNEVSSRDERIIIEISISELIAGTNMRGSLADRTLAIRQEVPEPMARALLFFDEIHSLFAGDLADEIQGEFKVALARGELPCIGATTPEEYKRAIESDGALARRFSLVEVEEPDQHVAREILAGSTSSLAKHHSVSYAGG